MTYTLLSNKKAAIDKIEDVRTAEYKREKIDEDLDIYERA